MLKIHGNYWAQVWNCDWMQRKDQIEQKRENMKAFQNMKIKFIHFRVEILQIQTLPCFAFSQFTSNPNSRTNPDLHKFMQK